ncbi:MAG: 2-oxoacid:ferredoxin oxidoreductase subunit gamma, partial [Clostridiales bacterium]|nr:2-oxoacid:ferredoxin oxidoreductase subunit gamma [Clostridiales bacterium]
LLIVNSSLVNKKAKRDDIDAYYVPANEIADQLGNFRVANMVMLGAYLEKTQVLSLDSVMKSLREVLGPDKEHLVPINQKALERGARLVTSLHQSV